MMRLLERLGFIELCRACSTTSWATRISPRMCKMKMKSCQAPRPRRRSHNLRYARVVLLSGASPTPTQEEHTRNQHTHRWILHTRIEGPIISAKSACDLMSWLCSSHMSAKHLEVWKEFVNWYIISREHKILQSSELLWWGLFVFACILGCMT